MPTIYLSSLEANALFSAAGNMTDDFEDYFSFVDDLPKFYAAFQRGMDKLAICFSEGKYISDAQADSDMDRHSESYNR